MSVLSIDVGVKLGWARSDRTCGMVNFANADHGAALANFHEWIQAELDAMPLVTLALEPVKMTGSFNHRLTLLIEGVANMEAFKRDIPRTQRYATQVRKWLVGKATIPKKPGVSKATRDKMMDELVLAAVRARGFNPESEHAADAAALICMLEYRRPLGAVV